MNFSIKSAAILAGLVSLAAASPLPSLDSMTDGLVSRGSNEALYLANCKDYYYEVESSVLAYYSNGRSGSQNGQYPDSTATVSSNSWVQWEGQSHSGSFSKGGSATTNIQGNGQSVGVGNYAGSASNSYGQNFNCYEDNQRVLYQQSDYKCFSIYYCYDVSL